MKEITEYSEALLQLIENEISETRIIEVGSHLFDKTQQALIKIEATLNAVAAFSDLLSEIENICTSEDAKDMIEKLRHLAELLQGFPVQKRIKKEIRQIEENISSLPSLKEIDKLTKLNHAICTLDINAPICKRCGSNMVIQKGAPHFWRCEKFPMCWNKKRLTKTELDIIEAENNDAGGNIIDKSLSRCLPLIHRDEGVPYDIKKFNELRKWRNEQAKNENVPAYFIAKNEWLEQMIKIPIRKKQDFSKIKGFGIVRAKKYSDAIISILQNKNT
ncbi:MAG TPA: hypothetical protein DD725_08215 [Deltaproteobacteria bacterium]|nr:hypothetical protein [Deltaproteobacteria bacterium]